MTRGVCNAGNCPSAGSPFVLCLQHALIVVEQAVINRNARSISHSPGEAVCQATDLRTRGCATAAVNPPRFP